MKTILKSMGGLGKQLVLSGVLNEIDTKNIRLIAPHKSAFEYSNKKLNYYSLNETGLEESPLNEKNIQIKTIDPYEDMDFINKSSHLYNICLKQIKQITNQDINVNQSVPFYKWGKNIDSSKIKISYKMYFDILNKIDGKIVVLEHTNSQHNFQDLRSLTLKQSHYIIDKLIEKGYYVVVLSSRPDEFFEINKKISYYNPLGMGGFVENISKGLPRILYMFDLLGISVTLREYADYFISIDSHLPHLANTTFIRENKDLEGIVLWGNTDPKIFGYSNNKNISNIHKDHPNRTFGLGTFDNWNEQKYQHVREWDLDRILNYL